MTEYTCCIKPNIATMDYYQFMDSDGCLTMWPNDADAPKVNMVNRVCLKCYTHWAGPEGEVKRYTGKEWDAMIAESLKK